MHETNACTNTHVHMWASLTMATELHVHNTTYTQTQISKKKMLAQMLNI